MRSNNLKGKYAVTSHKKKNSFDTSYRFILKTRIERTDAGQSCYRGPRPTLFDDTIPKSNHGTDQ